MDYHFMILCVLVLFIAKHFVCDYPLQFHYMIHQKGIYGAIGGIHHSGIHALGTALILLPFINPIAALLAGGLDGFIHYHVDWAKQNITRKYNNHDREFWILLGLDQAFHYLTYAFIMGLLII